jgi:hypothetical protein
MTFDFAPLAWVYLVVGMATLAITFLSRHPAHVFGAAIMLASWLVSNEVVAAGGIAALIAHDAAFCAILGVCAAVVGTWARSRALAIVFGLFGLNIAVDIGFLGVIGLNGLAVTPLVKFCYACTVNAIFLASCLALGMSAGVRTRLVHSGPTRPRQPYRDRKRRAAVVAGMARARREG